MEDSAEMASKCVQKVNPQRILLHWEKMHDKMEIPEEREVDLK